MSGVFVFDAYGTLFDVHSAVARHRARVGPQADSLSEIWRAKQLEYSWIRTMCGAYRDFEQLTAQALDYASARCGGLDTSVRRDLLAAYDTLAAYPDVRPTLMKLRDRGARLAILSNGTPDMLASAVAHAGLEGLFEHVLSVDAVRRFKTVPEAYALVGESMNVAPADVSFQSSNRWDIAGAVKAGFRTVWINRASMPDEYFDLAPDRVVTSLEALA